jgi:hypothetical protein
MESISGLNTAHWRLTDYQFEIFVEMYVCFLITLLAFGLFYYKKDLG